MGRFLIRARYHVGKIEHFHRHAGVNGFKQAKSHYSELSELNMRASRSKNDTKDSVIISLLRESVEGLMKEMQEREEGSSSQKS